MKDHLALVIGLFAVAAAVLLAFDGPLMFAGPARAHRADLVAELRELQQAYLQADQHHRPAIASLIRHRAAGAALPSDLSKFLKTL